MPFPPSLLTDDEELILDLRPHWWYLTPVSTALGLAIVVGLAALIAGWPGPVKALVGVLVLAAAVWWLAVFVKWNTTNFVVTNERVISRTGVIAKKGIEIPLDRINTVFFDQTLFERLIGAGDLGIESAGEGGRQTFTDIRRPNLVQNEIYRQKELLEERRLTRLGQAAAAAGSAADPGTGPSIPEQIDQLDELRRRGVLSDAEFEAKKRDLLDRM
ncbi:MAG: PH domain-containing protein [Actinomyces sp.]|nr:MAG: PH domain-containing protein [Actinomyces sp.]